MTCGAEMAVKATGHSEEMSVVVLSVPLLLYINLGHVPSLMTVNIVGNLNTCITIFLGMGYL